MPSVEHRETLIQQYSKEPQGGSASRGTAINLQEELEEIAPFKGSYQFEQPQVDEDDNNDGDDDANNDDSSEPNFMQKVVTFNELNQLEDEPNGRFGNQD